DQLLVGVLGRLVGVGGQVARVVEALVDPGGGLVERLGLLGRAAAEEAPAGHEQAHHEQEQGQRAGDADADALAVLEQDLLHIDLGLRHVSSSREYVFWAPGAGRRGPGGWFTWRGPGPGPG